MNTFIWIIQGLLSLVFLMAGFMKISQPKEKLKEKVGGWVEDFSETKIKLIGTVELLASLGLVLPMALNILQVLTPLVAIGLILDMAVAAMTHLNRKENKSVILNMVLLLLALFVVYGRLVLDPVV